ncbi:MAG TPA: hypothetical protein VLY87_02420 [Flavobacterium sp.]|nr:hypothetical protein [Flavobacterium sp.]
MYYIRKHIEISNGSIWEDGNLLINVVSEELNDVLKTFYKSLEIAYPKFYKMDDLCKLAFIGTELLLKNIEEKNIALLFSNWEASLDTDLKHQESIQSANDFFPSPAVFVYTLPNITIGEVSIRHGLQTENAFFVAKEFPTETMVPYANYLLESGKAEMVVCAWIHKFKEDYRAVFYLVDQAGSEEHKEETVNKILKK